MLADTFGKRLVGIHGAPRSWGVLIPGRSVHGMFIVGRLWTVGLDRGLRVLGVRRRTPGVLVVFEGADAVLEFRGDRVPFRAGWELTWKGGVPLWPGY